MSRTFKATPLTGFASGEADVLITAETDLAALRRAREVLGDGTCFDLCEGDRSVVAFRSAQFWRGPEPKAA